ncbi:MAG: hypothetical protein CL927_01745 [Deltaproteobacteria bacterium]|nr:hypothetical protein [Deltaproteobacteria bacterium]HCH63442.1 hypothetical protein [Deltaproteobacteria bacterium]
MTLSRPVSGLEVKWLAAHRIDPPFALDFVLELDGLLEVARLERAWQVVVTAHPGLRVRMKGRLARRRWVADGALPPLVSVRHPGWTARTGLPQEALAVELDPERGPVAVLGLVPGPGAATHTLVLRVLHAVTDGRGGLAVLRDLLAVLRGESLGAPRFVVQTDAELSRAVGGVSAPPPVADRAPHARGGANRGARGGTWTRVTLPAPAGPVYGSVVQALARWPDRGPLRYTLPVDLRRHRPDLPVTIGNLTGLVHMEVSEVLQAADGAQAFARALRQAVEDGHHHGPVLESEAMRKLPLRLLSGAGGALSTRDHRRGVVPASATVSNLGRLDLSAWTTGDLHARAVFVGAPASPGLPLLAVLTGNDHRLEVTGAVPAAWGGPHDWAEALAGSALSASAGSGNP